MLKNEKENWHTVSHKEEERKQKKKLDNNYRDNMHKQIRNKIILPPNHSSNGLSLGWGGVGENGTGAWD